MSNTPKDLQIDEKWDRLIDLSLRRVTYGLIFGGVTSLILLRSPHARTAVTAFSAGAGLGSAWQQSSKEFETLVPDALK